VEVSSIFSYAFHVVSNPNTRLIDVPPPSKMIASPISLVNISISPPCLLVALKLESYHSKYVNNNDDHAVIPKIIVSRWLSFLSFIFTTP
jgi:hypothetical protein